MCPNRNDNSTTSTASCETCSQPSTMMPKDGNGSRPCAASSRMSSTSSTTMTPAYRTPRVLPEGAVTISWTFQTSATANRWMELMRDMIPCAYLCNERYVGWEPRWSVSKTDKRLLGISRGQRSRPASPPEFLVELTLWWQPQGQLTM